MFHSTIISSISPIERETALQSYLESLSLNIQTPHPDLLVFDTPGSLGIDEVREAIRFASIKPYSLAHKVIVVKSADKLTHPAQNAFLKLIEEPPSFLKIFLLVSQTSQLLDTVLSRCHTLTPDHHSDSSDSQIFPFDWSKFLVLTQKLSSREAAIELIQNEILILHQQLLTKPHLPLAHHLSSLSYHLNLLQYNVSLKLTFDSLGISLASA